jgi:hypothetical protein
VTRTPPDSRVREPSESGDDVRRGWFEKGKNGTEVEGGKSKSGLADWGERWEPHGVGRRRGGGVGLFGNIHLDRR